MKKIPFFSLTAMLILAVALSGCGGGGGNGGGNPDNPGGPVTYPAKIVFNSDRGYTPQLPPEGLNIFSMNYDGSEIKQLTADTDGTINCCPELSPDNSKIVYVRKTLVNSSSCVEGIWVMNSDGTGKIRINYTPSSNIWGIFPSWTPDGQIIFYNSDESKVYIATASGAIVTQININLDYPLCALRVSPDGKKILLAELTCSLMCFYDFNGTSITNQTIVCSSGDAAFFAPSWSLDGTKIIFASDRPDGGYGIFSINAASPPAGFTPANNIDNATRLINCVEPYYAVPLFSRNGTRIIFADRNGAGGDYEIYSINPDGSGKTSLTNNAAYDSFVDYD